MRLEICNGRTQAPETARLGPMSIDPDEATLSDGGTYFLTLTRVDLLDLLMHMDDERQRRKDETAAGEYEESVRTDRYMY